MNFLEKFKTICANIDNSMSVARYDEFAPIANLHKKMIEPTVEGKRYNIHKRSLPVGTPPLDKIVFFNVSKRHAELLISQFLKTKCYDDHVRDTKTIIYYDVIPVDAQPRERSIYYNAGFLTKEEGSEPESIEIMRDTPHWVG